MNIEYLKLFVRIATTHNISSAGKELGLSPAVSSTHISKLEDSLGVRLIHRTTRKVSLTEEGLAFLPHAQDVLDSIETAKESIGIGDIKPKGRLRVAAPASFGRMHLLPSLNGFLQQYPDLVVDLHLSDSVIDMVEGGFDIAIRDAKLNDSTLIARKLSPVKRIVCASPEYLKAHGEPKSLEDLLDHNCINLIGLETWEFDSPQGQKSIKTKNRLRTDNGEAARDACIQSLGITICSTWCCYEQLKKNQLVHILRDYPCVSDTAIWAVYPSSRLLAPKVRLFIDYLSEYFRDLPF